MLLKNWTIFVVWCKEFGTFTQRNIYCFSTTHMLNRRSAVEFLLMEALQKLWVSLIFSATVLEIKLSELKKEVFIQLVSNSPPTYLKNIESYCMYEIRRKTNGLMPNEFSRTVTKNRSLENTLRKCFNWILKFGLIPDNIKRLSLYQIRANVTNISKVYVITSNETFDYFYNKGVLNFRFLHLDLFSVSQFNNWGSYFCALWKWIKMVLFQGQLLEELDKLINCPNWMMFLINRFRNYVYRHNSIKQTFLPRIQFACSKLKEDGKALSRLPTRDLKNSTIF